MTANTESLGMNQGYLVLKAGSGQMVWSREFSMNSIHKGKVFDGYIRVFKFDRPAVNCGDRPYELRVRSENGEWVCEWVEVKSEEW